MVSGSEGCKFVRFSGTTKVSEKQRQSVLVAAHKVDVTIEKTKGEVIRSHTKI